MPIEYPTTTAIVALASVWATPPGFYGWLTAVNHRAIGVRYMVTAFGFMVLAGILALVMRVQLAWPELNIVDPAAFNQLFTMHGTTMMFLFAVPMMEGLGIYLVPLMIGTRDMAFPRLNAFGYWVYLFAGVTLYVSLVFGAAPDGGWFAYPPLTGPGFSLGVNLDVWVTMVTFLEVAALAAEGIESYEELNQLRALGGTVGGRGVVRPADVRAGRAFGDHDAVVGFRQREHALDGCGDVDQRAASLLVLSTLTPRNSAGGHPCVTGATWPG